MNYPASKVRLRLFLGLAAFALAPAIEAQTPYLVKDINPSPSPASSDPSQFIVLGSRALFSANAADGPSLWSTDGTPLGTRRLTPPCDVTCGSPWRAFHLASDRYFYLATGPNGLTIWVTDGTRGGTRPLDMPTLSYSDAAGARTFLRERNTLLFCASDGEHGNEMWRTDGTAVGTFLLADLSPGIASTFCGRISPLADKAVFLAGDAEGGKALWTTDGTPEGTTLLRRFATGDGDSLDTLTVLGSRAYFATYTPNGSLALWSTNGTVAGTARVKVLAARPGASLTRAVARGDRLFLLVTDDDSQRLWVSDGKATGTFGLTTFPGRRPFGDYTYEPRPVFPGERVLPFSFTADDGVHGVEPWITDGTRRGTRLLRDICPGTCSSGASALASIGNTQFFSADDGTHGDELWASRGDAATTRLVKDICPGACSSHPSVTRGMRGRVAFYAMSDSVNWSLWSTEGTTASTVPIGPVGLKVGSEAALAGERMVFAGSLTQGYEPWVTDGTTPGTRLLRDIDSTDLGGSNPEPFASAGARELFLANDGVHGGAIWWALEPHSP